MNATQEVVIKVTADMSHALAAFDVLIEEMTATRDRLRSRLENLADFVSQESKPE